MKRYARAALAVAALLWTGACMNSLDEAIPPVTESRFGLLRAATVNGRVFYYAEPLAPPPAGGYPVAMLFHGGDGYAADWIEILGWPNGVTTTGMARRYFIVAPESGISDESSGSIVDVKKRWDAAVDSRDIPYILDIAAWLTTSGYLINPSRLFAVGISSGGGMVSRMCQATPGLFRRVCIVASCNPTYSPYVSSNFIMNANHPSTLFIHGTADAAVPYARMQEYYSGLTALTPASGVSDTGPWVKFAITVAGGGHTWFGQYNANIYDWFDAAP